MKAIASGNPAVLTLSEADAELQRLAVLRKNHADEQFLARRNLRELPETIQRLTNRLMQLENDRTTVTVHAASPIAIGGRDCRRDDVPTILGKRLDALPEKVSQPTRIPLGTYRGLGFGIVLDSSFAPEVHLEGATIRQATLSREHRGPRAVLNALERLAGSYGEQCEKARQELALAEGQFRDYEQRIGKPFAHEAYLTELTELRDRLKDSLSNAPAPEGEGRPSAAELAERIKALKAAHTIEAAPRRTLERLASVAEEPVTARARRRIRADAGRKDDLPPAEAMPSQPVVVEPATDPETPRRQAVDPKSRPDAPASRPKSSFREQLAHEKRRRPRQPTLF